LKYELYGITGREVLFGCYNVDDYLDWYCLQFQLDEKFNFEEHSIVKENHYSNFYAILNIMGDLIDKKDIYIKTFDSKFILKENMDVEYNSKNYRIKKVIYDEKNDIMKIYTDIQHQIIKLNEDEELNILDNVDKYNKRIKEINKKQRIIMHESIFDKIKNFLFGGRQ